ncbi:Hypothetical predicted protein [Pelobates cultripes]|uniref:Uncharacterized protein n=1 Tax=Pelobates cultripes TaxID=61616 RepID=A0AAD1SA63_PELCU|nr:Hypothetical predicted protein [Pelobates cultripes]
MGAHDIGSLLLHPVKTTAVPTPSHNGNTASTSSGEQILDELDDFPGTGELHSISSDKDNKLPSTKGDIKAPLCNICSLFTADIAVLREEILTMETEVDSQGLTVWCIQLEDQNVELQRNQTLLTTRLDAVEDRHRIRNIKIKGVPETVTQDDLPWYIGRFLTSLLTPQQTKTVLTDGVYRIPRDARAPADIPRDVILQFQSQSCQTTLMAVVRGKATHLFEIANLSFFQDLSRPTLLWRALLKPLTVALRQNTIPYPWAFPRSLIITHRGAIESISDPPPRQEQATTDQRPKSHHTWDVANVRLFQPANTTSSSTAYKAQRINRHLADT